MDDMKKLEQETIQSISVSDRVRAAAVCGAGFVLAAFGALLVYLVHFIQTGVWYYLGF